MNGTLLKRNTRMSLHGSWYWYCLKEGLASKKSQRLIKDNCLAIHKRSGSACMTIKLTLMPTWFTVFKWRLHITTTFESQTVIKTTQMCYSHSIFETKVTLMILSFQILHTITEQRCGHITKELAWHFQDVIYGCRRLQSSLVERTGSVYIFLSYIRFSLNQRDVHAICHLVS